MLGIALILVGIVLVHNGVLFLSKTKVLEPQEDGKMVETLVPLVVKSPKSIAFFNAIVGGILLILNFVGFAFHRGQPLGGFAFYQNIAAGMIFGVTYLFIAGNLLFKLDMKPFGFFSLGATIFAAVLTVLNFRDFARVGFGEICAYTGMAGYSFLWLALLWLSWFVLWLTGVLEFVLNIKKMQKIFPYVSIAVGVVGAFVPALLLLTGVWGLLG